MMIQPNYRQFIFEDYDFDRTSRTLVLRYSLDRVTSFEERYLFNFPLTAIDQPALLDQAFLSLWIMAGISYFKAYLPAEIVIDKGGLTADEATFFATVYTHGLGQFFAENDLDPRYRVRFPVAAEKRPAPIAYSGRGDLVSLGGGKDSLVSLDILEKAAVDCTTWDLGEYAFIEPLNERTGCPHLTVARSFDSRVKNLPGAYQGHVPISAIWAFCGVIVAILTGKNQVIVSNEFSANEPTIENYRGLPINHQYSKSSDFEQRFQTYLRTHLSADLNYFSLLRPLSELRIAELFIRRGLLKKYRGVFSSCNANFRLDNGANNQMTWCGHCPKCAFVFLLFAPFTTREELISLFGQNLFAAAGLRPTFDAILGRTAQKPYECVGEIDEARLALWLAHQTGNWPELTSYQPEPVAYDYRALQPHHMPVVYYQMLLAYIKATNRSEQE